jgi:hypothetical protein
MNLRLSILLVTVLVLFGGTFLVVRLTASTERDPEEDWMYRISEDDLYRIEVSNEGKDVVFTRNPGSFRWYIQEDPPVPVFIDKWSGTPLLLSGPRVNRTLTEVIENPASYGLDPPASRVKVVDGAGQSFEFHMGDPTPDGANQYTRLVGHPRLFTVPAIWAQVINRLALEPPYLRLYLLGEDDHVVFVSVTHGEETNEYGRKADLSWIVLGPPDAPEPQQIPVDGAVWPEILEFLLGPRAEDIVEDAIEDPAQFGLDPPEVSVRLGKATGPDVKFFVGDSTPDGGHRYVIVESDVDSKLYAMSNSRVKMITDLVADPPYGEAPEATPPPG